MTEFLSKFIWKIDQIIFSKVFKIFACDSRQQLVQFDAQYPLLDSRSDLEFTFSYAIL